MAEVDGCLLRGSTQTWGQSCCSSGHPLARGGKCKQPLYMTYSGDLTPPRAPSVPCVLHPLPASNPSSRRGQLVSHRGWMGCEGGVQGAGLKGQGPRGCGTRPNPLPEGKPCSWQTWHQVLSGVFARELQGRQAPPAAEKEAEAQSGGPRPGRPHTQSHLRAALHMHFQHRDRALLHAHQAPQALGRGHRLSVATST